MLAQNLNDKCDQPIAYASQLLSSLEQNYTTTEWKVLAMVYALHKFHHYLFSNQFVFYVDHMALTYLINKPQLFDRIAIWLLLFLEYDFIVINKLGHIQFSGKCSILPPSQHQTTGGTWPNDRWLVQYTTWLVV
jgi:hypothetical protein